MFDQPAILIYIRRNSIEVFLPKSVEKIEFPAEVLSHNEILNEEKYTQLVNEFLAKFNLKSPKVNIVLSDEIVFQKSLPLVESDQLNLLVQKFNDSVPFEVEKIASKHILSKDELQIFTTNKKLYWLIEQRIAVLGGQVVSVVPLFIFKEKLKLDSEEISGEIASKILENKQLLNLGNFLKYEEISLSNKKSSKMPLILMGIITLLFSVGIVAIYFFGFLDGSINKIMEKISPAKIEEKTKLKESTPSAEKIATSSAKQESTASAQVKKEDLKIKILNGTGVAGQAAKVKDQLSSLGYKNFELGNATGAYATETVVVFSSKVSTDTKTEIINELKKSFVKVSQQDTVESQEFDILITTGKNI